LKHSAALWNALSINALKKSWKSVRQGLRNQPITDIHDYLDIQRNTTNLFDRIRRDIAQGSFRPKESEVITREKKYGIARRLVIPSAIDAIVLQAIVDFIETPVLNAAPTSTAYYTRSHLPPSINQIDESFPYPWWKLWPVFQEKIWNFAFDHNYVVFTDIANYYDAIPLSRLRNKITSLHSFPEELIDLLFLLLEAFVWRPNYIPFSGVGLPQIQFDAPRLLAHAYLYDIDKLVSDSTKGDFVRWMDDMDLGAESFQQAKYLLAALDSELSKLGLRVNTGKTHILKAKEALEHLWVNENRRLNLYNKLLSNSAQKNITGQRIGKSAFSNFKKFYRRKRIGQWDKILKRYITIFNRTRHKAFDRYTIEILQNLPAARDNIFSYYRSLGYTPYRFSKLSDFLTGGHCNDDVSYFAACSVLTDWHIPPTSTKLPILLEIIKSYRSNDNERIATIIGGLRVIAKYDTADELAKYIYISNSTWRRSEWASRQVAAVIPFLEFPDQKQVRHLVRSGGLHEALSVLASLDEIVGLSKLDKQLSSYLYHSSESYPYPFSKVVLAKWILSYHSSLSPEQKTAVLQKLSIIIKDRVYRRHLEL